MLEDLSVGIGKSVPKWFFYIAIFLCICLIIFFIGIYPKLNLEPNKIVSEIDTNIQLDAVLSSIEKYCEVSGAVVNPNVYPITDSTRLSDLIKSANGFSKYADITWVANNLNLSKKATDECKVYIPFAWDINQKTVRVQKFLDEKTSGNDLPDSKSTSSNTPSVPTINENTPEDKTIDINKCDKNALLELRGIGPAYADRIIANRPYANIEELQTKAKLSANLVSSIKNSIKF